jgi:hypothetical protein
MYSDMSGQSIPDFAQGSGSGCRIPEILGHRTLVMIDLVSVGARFELARPLRCVW